MAAENKPVKSEQTEVVRREDQGQYFQPATDVVETADAVILTFDMPGVAKENVDVTIDKDMLIVTGKADPEETGEALYRETHVGDYRRQFTLTGDVDPDRIMAAMNNGVLTVEIGKAEQAKPKKIEIAVAK